LQNTLKHHFLLIIAVAPLNYKSTVKKVNQI